MTDRKKLVELIKLSDACLCDLCGEKGAQDRAAGVIAANILASGQVIVLPCKIGDEVWKVEPTGCNGAGCPYNGDFGNWRCNVNGKQECRPFVYSVPFTYAMIGTKFYLTREKAEAVLRKEMYRK